MEPRFKTSVVWFRRDLRLADHAALAAACRSSERVICAFVLDPVLLRGERVGAPIVQFFFDSLGELREDLRERGSDLALLEGDPTAELRTLAQAVAAQALFYNEDDEPQAMRRDARVGAVLTDHGVRVASFVDAVYFGHDEVVQPSSKPYVVYTPYRRRWMERLAAEPRPPLDSTRALRARLLPANEMPTTRAVPQPGEYGHGRSADFPAAGERRAKRILATFVERRIADYEKARNEPALEGTSCLSPHLRAGTIGIRTCVAAALDAARAAGARGRTGADAWLGELIWRDFYHQILAHFPHVDGKPFLAAAEAIPWREADSDFAAWCGALTGYPIVDAAMMQLNRTGWMHNRLRMIVASFLTKDLLIDWRRGERYFERHLADADLAANNGGWQWAASTGTDAAPYFRVFNPVLQSEKFDPQGAFIKKMLPALARIPARYIHAPWTMPPLVAAEAGVRLGGDYPEPIVDHAAARTRALAAFAPVFGRGAAPRLPSP